VLLETWLVPAKGTVDRFGPKWIVVIAVCSAAIAWTMNSFAIPGIVYFAAALGGIGAGGVYGTASAMRCAGSPGGAAWRRA